MEQVRAFIGKDVLGPNGNVLGTLSNITTNANGQPEKLVVSRGGFLGLFQSQYAVDWAAAKPKIEDGKLVVALTPQDLTQTANK
ncbi:MAG: PRC-barrel domain-containing protein [Acetobacteraceae bacterium]|nr:PRC-barrel domain-containing protein [Acetobacteraceae bacterium]